MEFEIRYLDCNSVPVDLSPYGARMQFRDAPGSSNLYATLSSSLAQDGTGLNLSGSRSTKPPTSGSIGVYISAQSSSLFTFDEAYYDLELTSGSYVTRLLMGKVKISKEVTTNG